MTRINISEMVPSHSFQRRTLRLIFVFVFLFGSFSAVLGHPLGNFTINHFSRLEVGTSQIKVRYVIDMAEIPTFQEFQTLTGENGNQPPFDQLKDCAARLSASYAGHLILFIDDEQVPLRAIHVNVSTPSGSGGLPTLRVECEFAGVFSSSTRTTHNLSFDDQNYIDRIGWREIVVKPLSGVSVFNSSGFGSPLTEELKTYPNDLLAAPPNERRVDLAFTDGSIPTGSRPLLARDGRSTVVVRRDLLTELIAVPTLSPKVAVLGCLLAVLLGGLHAMSPGHGKAIVGAYLVGARGTAKHAAFLGLIVTVTHTAGVFALGLTTLLASEYIVPETLYPIMTALSGATVVVIGLNLLVKRLRAFWARFVLNFENSHSHEEHSHGGATHSHFPAVDDGSITWRNLLGIGVSGGILPCPSALVVLLAAISLHRVGYGLLLVVAFSMGLAAALTSVGLIFIYVKRLIKVERIGPLEHVLPIFSAGVITCAGIAICYGAFGQHQFSFSTLATLPAESGASLLSAGAFGVLALGLIYGLKHATEADHIVAVSTIVSEHQKLGRAAIVGALWGMGHTLSLLTVGAAVLVLKFTIPDAVAGWLEFVVALMIISLGVLAIRRALRNRIDFHHHKHTHGNLAHTHIHFHDPGNQHETSFEQHSHSIRGVGFKPIIVGAIHGLAGSAALTLLVLTQIKSSFLGLLYLGVFGLGSILGMLVMSGLVGLPFVFSSRKVGGVHYSLQLLAGVLSIAFGIWYAYATGIASIRM